jgi:CheY-like chemotaxis protein
MKEIAILCVDDEKFVLDSLRIQLKNFLSNDFFFEFAESAEEALDIIQHLQDKKTEYIVVISDWLMPGMKGDELLIQLNREHNNVINIMLTGQADQKSIDNAFANANLIDCIQKPWTEEELLKTISKGLKVYGIFKNLNLKTKDFYK